MEGQTAADGGAGASGYGPTPWRGRVARAVLTGAATGCWYALPDHVQSRRTRAAVRAALAVVVVASSTSSRSAGPSARSRPAAVSKSASSRRTTSPSPTDDVTAIGVLGAVGFIGAVAGAVLGAVGAAVAVDRGIYRIGERSARAGVRRPHTRNGVVIGVVAALASLVGTRS